MPRPDQSTDETDQLERQAMADAMMSAHTGGQFRLSTEHEPDMSRSQAIATIASVIISLAVLALLLFLGPRPPH